jgi:pyruvate dehydrogenase E2 component (dihydrolipoamide acetyltransferase)
MSDIQKILVPDVGGEEVEIIEICFAVGDTLEADEGIVTVESDKASMDIPAPFAGELASLSVKVGDKIKEGDVIGEIKKAGSDAPTEETPAEPEEKNSAPEVAAKDEPSKVESAPAVEPEATGASELVDVAVPDIGEDGEVDVIDVLVSVGDVIEQEDGLITLETDKATMDVPSTHAGTVKEVYISSGDKVKQGTLVIKLETAAGKAADKSPEAAPAAAEKPHATS